jgi:hypothetical protein
LAVVAGDIALFGGAVMLASIIIPEQPTPAPPTLGAPPSANPDKVPPRLPSAPPRRSPPRFSPTATPRDGRTLAPCLATNPQPTRTSRLRRETTPQRRQPTIATFNVEANTQPGSSLAAPAVDTSWPMHLTFGVSGVASTGGTGRRAATLEPSLTDQGPEQRAASGGPLAVEQGRHDAMVGVSRFLKVDDHPVRRALRELDDQHDRAAVDAPELAPLAHAPGARAQPVGPPEPGTGQPRTRGDGIVMRDYASAHDPLEGQEQPENAAIASAPLSPTSSPAPASSSRTAINVPHR